MKKVTALLLCLLLALSLAACGNKQEPTATKDPSDASASAQEDMSMLEEEILVPAGHELKVAFARDNAPYSFVDESGELAGIDVDIAKAVCEQNQWTFSAQAIDWADRDAVLADGKAECVWGPVSYSESSSENTMWSVYGGIYVDATVLDGSEFNKISDLKGKHIEVEPTALFTIEGESATELGKQLVADAGKVDNVADAATAYKDLAEGKCDAILVSSAADSTVDFDSFGDDVVFKALYDVDVYSDEADSSAEEFEVLNSNGVCDLELGVGFQTDSDLYYAVSQSLESLLGSGKVGEILDTWSKKDNGVYADAVGRCNLYQMQEYEPEFEGDESMFIEELEDEDLEELEDGSEAEAQSIEVDVTEDEDSDASVIVVK